MPGFKILHRHYCVCVHVHARVSVCVCVHAVLKTELRALHMLNKHSAMNFISLAKTLLFFDEPQWVDTATFKDFGV
jgi:hypothetical protein